MNDANPPAPGGRSRPAEGGRRPEWVRRSLSALSFWGAIALPAVYLPLLIVGVETTAGPGTFLGLFGLHVVSLVGGRRHRRPVEA